MGLPDAIKQQEGGVPLCVDLDGTLVKTDTLIESALLLVKSNPLTFFLMLYWLLHGKARLKQEIARRVIPEATLLPYNAELLQWLELRRQEGRELVLVTAANERIAGAVADHLNIFCECISSSATLNMSSKTKRDELVSRYGEGGFDYAGNSHADVAVWAACREAIVVNAGRSTTAAARKSAQIAAEFPATVHAGSALLVAMRPRQWIKNVLVFISIVLAQAYTDPVLLRATVVAFIAFCLCSSSVYLINDLLDLPADRQHAQKRTRPFASGSAPLMAGVVGAPVLIVCALLLATFAGVEFLGVLLLYFCLTLAYSLFLKRFVLLDVLLVAMLYTLRIVGGAAVAQSMPTVWLMSFSLFIFTSLAMAKRYAELKSLEHNAGARAEGRGYTVQDMPVVAHLGSASGLISILVLALYVDSPELGDIYARQGIMWLFCPLLMYWIGRIWLLANRGRLHQDPVLFATRDPLSYVIFAFGTIILWAAL